MALLVRAARLVGPRDRGGRILVQTFLPHHPVVQAALLADPGRFLDEERERRRVLGLPPYGAYAEISGAGSDQFVESLRPGPGVRIVGGDEQYVARAGDWMELGRVLTNGERPSGSRLRIAVDPPR
jgi:primosomal protein N' (replication factor Y)